MAFLFWIFFFDQICPKWIKMDQTWTNWISHKSNNVSIESFYIYEKDKNVCLILDFLGSDLSKMDQTWSKLIKLDFSPIKKCYHKKSSHLQKMTLLFFNFFGSDLSKMDQTWSNWISHQSKGVSEWGDRFGGVDWIFFSSETYP